MAGPWAHPKTGILYYRKTTPPDLWAARDRLDALGVKVTREVHRSLGTKDQRLAEERYVEAARKQNQVWAGWRTMLQDGPQSLSHRQAVGLAADYAKAFLAKHEDAPFDVPPPPPIPLPNGQNDSALANIVARMPQAQATALKADLAEYLSADEEERYRLAFRLLERHATLRAIIGKEVARFV